MLHGEMACKHEHRRGASDVLLRWLTSVLCVVL
jgi:hypothetical protein